MTTTTVSAPVAPTRWPLAVTVAAGPLVTVAALHAAAAHGLLTVAPLRTYLLVALLFWSPLPFSIPAVLLDSFRDAALPGWRGPARLVRGVLLLPVLLTRGPGRVEVAASLAGFVAAVAVSAGPLLG